MRARNAIVALIALFLTLPAAYGVRKEYAPAKVIDVQEKSRDRVLLYEVNTPIMTEDPYVTISFDLNGIVYKGEFLPHNRHELFPGFCKPDEVVLVRLEKHFIYLKREDGSEARFLLTAKSRPQPARESH
jgi:hypothetical protein